MQLTNIYNIYQRMHLTLNEHDDDDDLSYITISKCRPVARYAREFNLIYVRRIK